MTVEAAVIREARVEDAEGFVRAHETAWNATAGAIVGKSLEELMPFEARVEHYRAGVAVAPGDARAWLAEQSGGGGDELCEDPFRPCALPRRR